VCPNDAQRRNRPEDPRQDLQRAFPPAKEIPREGAGIPADQTEAITLIGAEVGSVRRRKSLSSQE